MNFKNIFEWPLILKLLFFFLVGAFVFYMLYFLDISNLLINLESARQKEKSLKQELASAGRKEKNLNQETDQFTIVENTLAEWQKKLITYPRFPGLISEILQKAATNHLYFSLFTPGKEIIQGNYFQIPIKIKALGGYHDLANFLSDIANLPNIVDIKSFSISYPEKLDEKNDTVKPQIASTENFLEVEITLEVYYLAPGTKKKA